MSEVTIRELRNHGGDVVDRAAAGEPIVITRGGAPVAELRPAGRRTVSAGVLVSRWQHLPVLEHAAFRRDIDAVLDPRL
jgi:prevent-host-death family protein